MDSYSPHRPGYSLMEKIKWQEMSNEQKTLGICLNILKIWQILKCCHNFKHKLIMSYFIYILHIRYIDPSLYNFENCLLHVLFLKAA